MLEALNVSVYYGLHRAVEGASITVDSKEIVVILGANGAGKSTLLRAIAGLTPAAEGSSIKMNGTDITHRPPHEIVELGIALVPEDRGIFDDLTVNENLLLGARPQRARPFESANMDKVLSLFPLLAERQDQAVRTMSGGERQMVAIGRAMMSHPSILMLDEPSLGLSPLLCGELFRSLTSIKQTGVGILLVEQNAKQSLAIADRGYLLDNGQITGSDTAQALSNDQQVINTYLGGAEPGAGKIVQTPAADARQAVGDAVLGAKKPLAISAARLADFRYRIEDVLPLSISQLVERATLAQAEHVRVLRSAAQAPRAAKHNGENNGGGVNGDARGGSAPIEKFDAPEIDDLHKMLARMEKAAADAIKGRKG